MNHRITQSLCILLVGLVATRSSFAQDDSAASAKSALSAVRSQISGDEDRAAAWEALLALEPAAEELAKGEDADPGVIRKTIAGLVAAEKPMDQSRLTKLRDALVAWLGNEDNKEDATDGDKANDDDVPPPAPSEQGPELGSPQDGDDEEKGGEGDVEAARRKLEGGDEDESGMNEEAAEAVVEAVEDLNDWLKRTGGSAWSKILPLGEIADAADDPTSADPEEIKKYIASINAELSQLDRDSFVRLRRGLQTFQNSVEYPLEEDCAVVARKAISQFRAIDPQRVSNARNKVQSSVQQLNNFLATGSKAKQEGWSKFLKMESLTEQLNGGGTPLVGDLIASYNRFDSGEFGLKKSQFSTVRDDLKVYIELLQYSETASGRLAEGRRELQAAVDSLDRFLQSGAAEKEVAWKKFLEWETLTAQLEEEIPDSQELSAVQRQFESDEEGLEMAVFKNVGHAIAKVRELSRLRTSRPRDEDIYRSRIEKLARTLELHELDPSNSTATELVEELQWMEATGYVPEIASCIRDGFSKPNFFASVSGDFVTKQLNDTITDATPINREFEGSQLRGCARTTAQVTARLVPSMNEVALDVLLNGQTVSNSTAQQRKVFVRSQGNTSIVASKRLYASLDGLSAQPAVAQTSTSARPCGVCIDRRCNVGNRLIRRIANRKFEESRCKAQRMQSDEARDTITKRMDDQARDMISQANQRLQEFRATLQKQLQGRDELRPENLVLRSTAEKILAQGKLTAGSFLGAPSDPPQVGTDSDLTMQVHQSAINNALTSILGGIKLDNERMVAMMEENGLPVPDELKTPAKKEEPTPAEDGNEEDTDEDADAADDEEEEVDDEFWSITFDTKQPATVKFDEGKIRVAIQGRRFEQGPQEVTEPIEIAATYRLRKDSQGHLEARLVGEVDIVFVKSPGRLNTRQLAYKTFIKRKITPLFRRTFSTDDLPEGEMKEQVRALKIDEIESTRGWLAIAMSLEGLADTFQFSMNP